MLAIFVCVEMRRTRLNERDIRYHFCIMIYGASASQFPKGRSSMANVMRNCSVFLGLYRLVSCPRNTRYFAGGQLAVFQGASEAPISLSYGSSEQRGKTPTGPSPEGCDENGPAAALLVGHVSIQICSPPSASPARTAL